MRQRDIKSKHFTLADPGGGGLTAADLCFCMPRHAKISLYCVRSIRLRLTFSLILIEIGPKHA